MCDNIHHFILANYELAQVIGNAFMRCVGVRKSRKEIPDGARDDVKAVSQEVEESLRDDCHCEPRPAISYDAGNAYFVGKNTIAPNHGLNPNFSYR